MTEQRDTEPAREHYRSTLRYLTTAAGDGVTGTSPDAIATGPSSVGDVMRPDVVAAHEGAVFKEIVDALTRNRVSAVPVIDSDRRVIGVVSEADLLLRLSGVSSVHPKGHLFSGRREDRAKLHATTARELMTSPAVVTTASTAIVDAARLCATARVRRLPVVDDHGILVGIVSRSDLLRPFLRPDADIRTEIEQNVVRARFIVAPTDLEVTVVEGVATLRGQLETRSVAELLVAAIREVSGVVDVNARGLTYRVDDTVSQPAFIGY